VLVTLNTCQVRFKFCSFSSFSRDLGPAGRADVSAFKNKPGIDSVNQKKQKQLNLPSVVQTAGAAALHCTIPTGTRRDTKLIHRACSHEPQAQGSEFCPQALSQPPTATGCGSKAGRKWSHSEWGTIIAGQRDSEATRRRLAMHERP
jgi:hypothetical protein